MSTLTISEYVANPPLVIPDDSTLEVRGYYTRDFIASDGSTPIQGNPWNAAQGFYYSLTPTQNGSGNLVVPSHDIQPTTESNPTANYFEDLWVDGAFFCHLMPNTQGATGWQIPTIYGTEISFDEIATYNRAKRLLYPPDTYFTANETIEEIRRLSGDRAYASSTIVGITALSKDPDVPSFPEARGVNDPQWAQASVDDPSAVGDGFFDPDEGEFFGSSTDNNPSQFLRANSAINAANVEGLVFNLATYGGVCDGVTPDDTALALALGTIGSTQAILVLPYTVEGQCLLALDATIPANVTVDFDASGTGFLLTNSRTLTIVGPMIAAPHQVFFNARSGQGTVSFSGNHRLRTLYPEWWGAVGDSSTDCFAAIQAAEAALETLKSGILSFGSGSTNASYNVSAAVQISRVKGIKWVGPGRDNCRITATGGQPAVQTLGCWRSRFEGIYFTTSTSISSKGVFELDGDGTQGVQGNTFIDCYFDANQLAPYAFTMVRVGQGGAQGSENLFLNCNIDGGTEACYYQIGFNALQNTFVGGNCQSYVKNGISIVAGSVEIFSMGFQSTYGYTQVANGGFDIHVGEAGVGENIVVQGCRTESLQFFKSSSTQPGVLVGNTQTPSVGSWFALTPLSVGYIVIKVVDGIYKLQRVTTAGTTGGSEPTWPASGTVADGSVTWTQTDFFAIDTWSISGGPSLGALSLLGNSFYNCFIGAWRDVSRVVALNDDYTVPWGTWAPAAVPSLTLAMDASGGARTITLPYTPLSGIGPIVNQILTVKKTETSANTVTISSTQNIDGASTAVIPAGSRGYVTMQYDADNSEWWILSKSY